MYKQQRPCQWQLQHQQLLCSLALGNSSWNMGISHHRLNRPLWHLFTTKQGSNSIIFSCLLSPTTNLPNRQFSETIKLLNPAYGKASSNRVEQKRTEQDWLELNCIEAPVLDYVLRVPNQSKKIDEQADRKTDDVLQTFCQQYGLHSAMAWS